MSTAFVRSVSAAVPLLLVLAACALPAGMEPASPGGPCPLESVPGHAGTAAEESELKWYRASDERDIELASRWCATVGDPVIRLHPDLAGGWTLGDGLRVLSWNMWIGGGDLYRLLEEEVGLDCTTTPVARAPGPFVVLLQEVWRYSEDLPEVERSRIVPWTIDPGRTTGEDPDIVEAAERCGLALVYVPSARNGPDSDVRPNEDKGNAILSNLPLATPLALDLPLEGGRKVAVAATVRSTDGQRLRVVSAHLDVASSLVRTVLSGNQTRVRQASGLVEGLARARSDGFEADATIVGADMNTWAGNEATLDRMWQAFPESPQWDGLGTRGGFPTDHIFFRSAEGSGLRVAGYERVEDTYSSDHHPRSSVVRYERVE
jgi:endonuclease/exonuclease/phosphatase family metal-dependent hydrolase